MTNAATSAKKTQVFGKAALSVSVFIYFCIKKYRIPMPAIMMRLTTTVQAAPTFVFLRPLSVSAYFRFSFSPNISVALLS